MSRQEEERCSEGWNWRRKEGRAWVSSWLLSDLSKRVIIRLEAFCTFYHFLSCFFFTSVTSFLLSLCYSSSHSSFSIAFFLLRSLSLPPLPPSFALCGSIDGGQKHCLTFVEINDWNINTASLRERDGARAREGWYERERDRNKSNELEWETE